MLNSTPGISIGRAVSPTCVFRDQVFLCHATPADDNVYWLETVTPDGSVTMSPPEALEKEAEGISQSLIFASYRYRARGEAWRRPPRGQSRQRRQSWLFLSRPVSARVEAGTPDARYAILELISGRWSVTFRHVPYDHPVMAALARRNGDPEFATALETGRVR